MTKNVSTREWDYIKLKQRFDFQLAKIIKTSLGYEDHGMFGLVIEIPNQAYVLYGDEGLIGMAVARIVNMMGGDWEHLAGKPIYVLRDIEDGGIVFDERYNSGYIRGIATVPELGYGHYWVVNTDLVEESRC